ncbi:hypothetical protein JX266_005201 [Neoarthrinium moseri]|nr:hypothetical protein JX266_005201 [Neoarthrinium moseri]
MRRVPSQLTRLRRVFTAHPTIIANLPPLHQLPQRHTSSHRSTSLDFGRPRQPPTPTRLLDFPPPRNMSAVPSAASPPTSPPAKRHKPSTSISETTTTGTTMAAAAQDSSNGTAVPLLEQSPALLIKKLSDKARMPTRGSAFAAGYDMYAAQDTVIPSRGKALVETDIAIAVPAGTYGRVAPRSGLASKNFIDTGAGVIDADYRGPVKVLLFNHGEADFKVAEGDRVAQLIIERIYTPEVVEVAELEASVRGAGGFGSTGTN